MIAKEFYNPPKPLLSARSALLFFASVLLLYLVAGLFLQNQMGLFGIFLNQALFLALPAWMVGEAKGISLVNWPVWKKPRAKDVLTAALGMILLSLFVDFLVKIQDARWPPPEAIRKFYETLIQISSFKEGVAKVLILALTPALAEEIFFRGLLQPCWVARLGRPWGMALTALAFALAHGNFWHFHFYFILGFYLGALMEWRGSLWLPICGHLINNLWTLFSIDAYIIKT